MEKLLQSNEFKSSLLQKIKQLMDKDPILKRKLNPLILLSASKLEENSIFKTPLFKPSPEIYLKPNFIV